MKEQIQTEVERFKGRMAEFGVRDMVIVLCMDRGCDRRGSNSLKGYGEGSARLPRSQERPDGAPYGRGTILRAIVASRGFIFRISKLFLNAC